MQLTHLSVALGLVGVSLAATVSLPGGPTVAYGTKRTETAWKSYSVDQFVTQTVVSLFDPLDPKKFPAHSGECDYIVRFILFVV